MGNRYGRKQKRAHRQQVDLLQTQLHHGQNNERRLASELSVANGRVYEAHRRMKDWDHRIRSLLGPYTSAAIYDTTFRVDRHSIRQMPVFPTLSLSAVMGEQISDSMVGYVEEILYMIGTLDDHDRTQLSRRLYFCVDDPLTGKDREAAYGMSRSYFEDLMRRGQDGIETLARHIAPQIAQILLREKKKQRGAA